MKYLVMLCDGMADEPNEALQGRTPMEMAAKPCMDTLCGHAEVGIAKTVPDNMKPGSDVANLAVLGYDSSKCYTGRSPLEAASIGIELSDTDVTVRCNLVTLSDETDYEDKSMVDYCADDISSEEAKMLIEYLQSELGDDEFRFYHGVSYRHCLVWSHGDPHPGTLTPPHDISGRKIREYLPTGIANTKLYPLMKKSFELLNNHPVNIERRINGKRPANSIWLWGEGTKPGLVSFESLYGVKGSMISAVDLLKGIAICAKMTSVDVPGATGYIDTNFEGKAAAAITEFERGQELVYIHVEAPDECGHRNEPAAKVRSIELIDGKILAPVNRYLSECGESYAVLVCPDHPTPLNTRTHSRTPVPYFIYRSVSRTDSGVDCFTEKSAKGTGLFISDGYTLMSRLLKQ